MSHRSSFALLSSLDFIPLLPTYNVRKSLGGRGVAGRSLAPRGVTGALERCLGLLKKIFFNIFYIYLFCIINYNLYQNHAKHKNWEYLKNIMLSLLIFDFLIIMFKNMLCKESSKLLLSLCLFCKLYHVSVLCILLS